ncbi:ty3-gypsy retrotransposon protein [Tanacetum coccineum]
MTDLIADMLKDGLIKPSHSPYSSPVLLVRKKDGTWRFCVDYRALNAITILYRFPIPTVDELLDELNEVHYLGHVISQSGVTTDSEKIKAIHDWPKPSTAMSTLHVLALPDFSLIFDVMTDASGTSIGAVLSQQDKHIAFFSKKLSPQQYKWASKLLGYDFEVHYKPRKENRVADALSRIDESQLLSLLTPIFPWLQELRHHIHDGLVYIHDRLFIPDIPSLRLKLLKEFHSSTIGGHSGITATIKRISGSFSWPGLRKDVTRFIREFTICQQTKYSRQKPYGLLQALPIPNQVWEEISMDFITNLPTSKGKSAIWVIVDRLTKFAHFIALPPYYAAASLATLFLNHIYHFYGLPKSILSDRDPIFLSRFWKELFGKIGTKLLHSSAYHPQTDGQTEVVNRCLGSYLRCFACDKPQNWNKYLYLAEFWYNTSYHSVIEMTPFQALYGRPPPSLPRYTLGSSQVASIDATLMEHERVISLLKDTLTKTRQRMTDQANKHRVDKDFEVGELVYLYLRVYRQTSVARRDVHKLSRHFFLPFKVLEKIKKVAYRLDLPPGYRIHPVFHVSLLCLSQGDPNPSTLPLPDKFIDDIPVLQLEDILDHRTVHKHGITDHQVLVKWKGHDLSESTWETAEEIALRSEMSDLEDKVHFEEVDIDTVRVTHEEVQTRPTRTKRRPARFED